MIWIAVVVVAVVIGVGTYTQRRHSRESVDVLRSLLGQRVRLGIWTGRAHVRRVRSCYATIAAVDHATRFVKLYATSWDVGSRHDEVESRKGDVLHELERTGVIADRIKWIEPQGSKRIRLN
jgi:hypothetical protein